MPRAGVGIWAVLGSTGDSWRVLEVWGDEHSRVEASAEQVYPRSFPSRLLLLRPPGTGLRRKVGGGHSSPLLCLLFITVSCLEPSLSNHLPSRAELPEDKMNVCRPQSCDALEEVEGEEEGINTRHINKSWGEVRG